MLTLQVAYSAPPTAWDEITGETSRETVLQQWAHYSALFEELGYRMFPEQCDENGEPIPLLGPDLPPPIDSFQPQAHENYVHIPVAYVWNHQHIYQGIQVMLDESRREVVAKLIRKPSERELIEYLATQRRENPDPRNHTIPFLQLIDAGHCAFLIMPCWKVDSTPFYAMGEPVEMLKQCLEGLSYLHEHRIAHRDVSKSNIVMNYQGGDRGIGDRVKPFRSLFDARYAIIDFNCSTRFPGDEPLESIRTVGRIFTPPHEAPELSDTVPYNPFPVDIYALGQVIKDRVVSSTTFRSRVTELLAKHMPEFFDLVNSMMNPNPEARPTAAAAYEKICALQSQTDPGILALHGQPEDDAPEYGTPEAIAAAAQPQKDPVADFLERGGHPEHDVHNNNIGADEIGSVQPVPVDSNAVS